MNSDGLRLVKKQKLLQIIKKELKKISPKGRFKIKPPAHWPLAKKKTPDLAEKIKLHEFRYKDNKTDKKILKKHTRSPVVFEAVKRMTTISPIRAMLSSRENFNINIPNTARCTTRISTQKLRPESGRNSPNLETVNDIIANCCSASSPTVKYKVPYLLESCNSEMKKIVKKIDGFLEDPNKPLEEY